MRLNHFIAKAGITSRRKAVELINNGSVTVNGIIVLEPGYEVKDSDAIKVNGNLIKKEEKKIYILLNKPAGYVSTVKDEQGRATVLDLIPQKIKKRIYPVGRLDYNTTGLLLLTNDGDLANRLMHPRFIVKKRYHVVLDRDIPESVIMRIRNGVKLQDGVIKADYVNYWSKNKKKHIKIVLHSGKHRIVRRLFASLGYTVKSLDRFGYASFTKKGISKGFFRILTDREISNLKKLLCNKGK